MKTQIVSLALVCLFLVACDHNAGDAKDYTYYSSHLIEAKSVADQCDINGTSGMNKEQILQCNIAREAYMNRSYNARTN